MSASLGGTCSCFIRPGCINAQEEVDVVVLSIKLGLALSDSGNAQPVSVLLVNNSSLVHQSVCSRQGSALFR